ncbi:hypothetical protein LXA43DRAFT_1010963 [Ganoderma leucocontextum]|nr:hypothetical protein LXA43DRAFT_1010963 [Ganoderma leucocontextum]
MSFSTGSPAYGFFPTAPSAPNAFALFASIQSPRDTYNMYEDVRQALCPPSGHTAALRAVDSFRSFMSDRYHHRYPMRARSIPSAPPITATIVDAVAVRAPARKHGKWVILETLAYRCHPPVALWLA